MGHGVEKTELMGIGTKYVIGYREGRKLAVIARKDGTKEIYLFDKDHVAGMEHPSAVLTLDDEESRRLAAVLGGTFFGD